MIPRSYSACFGHYYYSHLAHDLKISKFCSTKAAAPDCLMIAWAIRCRHFPWPGCTTSCTVDGWACRRPAPRTSRIAGISACECGSLLVFICCRDFTFRVAGRCSLSFWYRRFCFIAVVAAIACFLSLTSLPSRTITNFIADFVIILKFKRYFG